MKPADVPEAYVRRVAQVESSGNPLAKARTSSALGLFQFLTSTWAGLRKRYPHLELTEDGRTCPVQSERAFRQFTADNASNFEEVLARPPSLSEMYLAHFAGARGAVAVCAALPTALVIEILGERAVEANPFLRGMTCADLRAWARRKVPDAVLAEVASATPAEPRPVRERLVAASPRRRGKVVQLQQQPLSEADRLNEAELRRIRGEG